MLHPPGEAGPAASVALLSWRRFSFARIARPAAVLLLAVMLGPVSLVQDGGWQVVAGAGASEASVPAVILPGHAMVIEPNTKLRLRLMDGRTIEARFVERSLLDSATYARRYDARSRASSYLPFALEESLGVTLLDGRQWTGAFAGYGELSLLLRNPDSSGVLRVPFDFATEVQRGNGDRVDPEKLSRAFRTGLLPSAEALTLRMPHSAAGISEVMSSTIQVPVEDIQSTTITLPANRSAIVGTVMVAAAATGLILYLILRKKPESHNDTQCQGDTPTLFTRSGVHPTTRPFDRDRRCYVGDPPPMAVAQPRGLEALPPVTFLTPRR